MSKEIKKIKAIGKTLVSFAESISALVELEKVQIEKRKSIYQPIKTKFPSGGRMNHSQVLFDEGSQRPKEFVRTKFNEEKQIPSVEEFIKDIVSMKEESKGLFKKMDNQVSDFFEDLNDIFKPKNQI